MEQEKQDWIGAYLELCALFETHIPEIKHIDLWYDQLNQEDEYPYPSDCLFMEFNTVSVDTIGRNIQDLNLQVRFIYALDTLADTFNKSVNQAVALQFGATIRKIHALLQGRSGENFGSLNRVGINKEQAPPACIAYSQAYTTIIRDYSALPVTQETQIDKVVLERSPFPPEQIDTDLFEVPL